MIWCWLLGGYCTDPKITCHCWGCGFIIKDRQEDTTVSCCCIPPLCICRRLSDSLRKQKSTTMIKTICCLNRLITETPNYKQTTTKCGTCYENISYKEYNTGASKTEVVIHDTDQF